MWLQQQISGKVQISIHMQFRSDFSKKLTDSLDYDLSPESVWDNNHFLGKTEQIHKMTTIFIPEQNSKSY